jgi:hypothetical protein
MTFPQAEGLMVEMGWKGLSAPRGGLLGVLRKQSMRQTGADCTKPRTGGGLTFRLNVVAQTPR